MASLLGCFKPRQARLSESGITSLVAKKHSAIAAIITGLNSSSADTICRKQDDKREPNCANFSRAAPVCDGLGILIYPSLLLTTHSTIPSPDSAHDAEINLRYSDTSLNILRRRFLPELFFATDAKLNVTVIACEFVNPEMHPLGLDTSKVDKAAYEVGSKVYVLGHDRNKGSPIKISVGCGYVITEHDGSIAVRSREEAWLRGSAGFDHKGNFALMVTDSDPDNAKALKNVCISLHSIKDWLEPQWQVPKSDAASTPRPRATLLYTRRATYAGSEPEAFIGTKANGNGKITHCSSVALHADSDKLSTNKAAGSGAEGGRYAQLDNADEGFNSKSNEGKQESREEEEKFAAMKSEAMRKASTMKEDMMQGRESKPGNTFKVVEVSNEATSSMIRGANAGGNLDKTSKKSRVLTIGSSGREEVQASKEKKGGVAKGSLKMQAQATMEKRAKPTLQQAFQRDRRSLQLRLHDIPIKNKL